MEDLLKSISNPVITYKIKDSKISANDKAYDLLGDSISIKDFLDKIMDSLKEKELLETFHAICEVNQIENIVSFYRLLDGDTYFIIINKVTPILNTLYNTRYFPHENEELDFILESIHDDVLLTDGQGKILKVSSTFKDFYGVCSKEVIGKSVFVLEKLGIFRPSITAQVLRSEQKVTMVQRNKFNNEIVVTAMPIKDKQGEILRVISYSYRINDLITLQQQYRNLQKKMELYVAELEELRNQQIKFSNVIGSTKQIQGVLKLINKVAVYDANVHFSGESGVGKTLFARLLHAQSKRSTGPLIEINCGAIPETLLESELFGYEKGAFTGASREGKIGLIELAKNGTLFLDEIAELSLNLQVKLLKAIQDKTITRIGGTKEIKIDFRLVTATNRDLHLLTEQKKFREDLFYRLNVIPIHIPSLRDRKDDILPLSLYFTKKFNKKYNFNKIIDLKMIDYLLAYHWPGNIRELENVIERALLTSDHDLVTAEAFPVAMINPQISYLPEKKCTLKEALENLERELILNAYEKYKTTVDVAKQLGISQPTAVRKIKKYIDNY